MKTTEDIYPLSPMQQGILFHALYAPEAHIYFQQLICTIRGELDVASFTRAWQDILNRHPVLRTGFVWGGFKEPVQVVHSELQLQMGEYDYRGIEPAERQNRLESFLHADRERGFDFSKPPLVRCSLIRASDLDYDFILSYHHLILDGWSLPLLFKEASAFYEAYSQGRNVHLPLPRPYRDFIVWLRHQDQSSFEHAWRKALRGFTAKTSLGTERITFGRSADKEHSYDERQIKLTPATSAALHQFAKQRLTLNTIFQSVWGIILSRYSGEKDVVFGAVVSGRPAELLGAESMIGLLTNILPVRIQVTPSSSFILYAKKLQDQQVELQGYECSSLLQIREWSEVPRGLPLFETILVFENYQVDHSLWEISGKLRVQQVRGVERTHYPLAITVEPGQEISLRANYDRRRFDDDTIERMLGHFQTLLEAVIAPPGVALSALPTVTKAEERQLADWNRTENDFPFGRRIHQLFEELAERMDASVAVVYQDEHLSYGQLNRRANQLAHYLKELGVGPEVYVGVYLERSMKTVIALLAIFKAGGAYVPLDPAYPPAHLELILSDIQIHVLVSEHNLTKGLPQRCAAVIYLDTAWETIAQCSEANPYNSVIPENVAYVMHTSGSTGRPKGVVVEHKQLLNRFEWMWKTYPFTEGEVACQRNTVNFSISMWELLGPLLQGVCTVIIPDEAVKDPYILIRTLATYEVTRIVMVPSLLRMILETDADLQFLLSKLKTWSLCGEKLTAELYRRFRRQLPQARLLNQYGASEVNDVSWYDTSAGTEDLQSIPIGCPISNVKLLLLDHRLRQVPIGASGELYVSSISPARGYLNDPGRTAERFIPSPYSATPGARLYKTGDLARYLSTGNLQHLGRTDHQVKIHGHRIELHGIEEIINRHHSVGQAVVIAREIEPGVNSLIAYIVPTMDPAQAVSEIRKFLKENLPSYMIPSAFITLDSLPLTPNRKVDRNALPPPKPVRPEYEEEFISPRSETEKLIADTWSGVLGIEKIGIHDNFFDLGGNSLQATRIVSRLYETTGTELNLRHFFERPTIEGLAQTVTEVQYQKENEELLQAMEQLERLSDEEVESELNRRLKNNLPTGQKINNHAPGNKIEGNPGVSKGPK